MTSSSAREVVSMTTGIRSVFVRLDFGQYLAAILPGEVQIEQDQPGPWRGGICALPAEERHCLFAIVDHMQIIVELAPLQRFARAKSASPRLSSTSRISIGITRQLLSIKLSPFILAM